MMLMRRSHAPPQRICVAQSVEHVTEETVELHARLDSVILELGPLQVLANIVLECPAITFSITGHERSPPGANELARTSGTRHPSRCITHTDRYGQAEVVRCELAELYIGHAVAVAGI